MPIDSNHPILLTDNKTPAARLLTLRRSPILLKLPPYLSAICILVGIAWLLLLPLDEYNRNTYISENAILPGQVHTYYGGSEHNIFRAYRQEVFALASYSEDDRDVALQQMMRDFGLKTARQDYIYRVAGQTITGTNTYGLLQGPRADATEAMVLIAAWRNFDEEINYSGVALALSLARYFKRWSIWSKDIILLIPADSTYGPEAWVSAYHSTSTTPTSSRNVSALPIKAGALQGAIALDYPAGPWGQRFDKLDILYDGINGALPNLDLLNTAVQVSNGQHGIGCSLHGMIDHSESYHDRLVCITKGIISQAAGHATGPHSAFMPYHVDAITLKTVGDGWHDEMSLGRVTESMFRSINNLLEHLHQSFFFYILMSTQKFVSIGSYLPAAMLVAGSFTINALALWVLSGKVPEEEEVAEKKGTSENLKEKVMIATGGSSDDAVVVPKAEIEIVERKMFLPVIIILAVHLTSFVPLYLLTHVDQKSLIWTFYALTAMTYILPISISIFVVRFLDATIRQLQILQSFSLLFLGATLSTWATINFSLALLVGLLAAPLNFVRPGTISFAASISSNTEATAVQKQSPTADILYRLLALLAATLYLVLSPPLALVALSFTWQKDLSWVLLEIAKGWSAQGVWSFLVIWSVWWPAWVLGGVVLFGRMGR